MSYTLHKTEGIILGSREVNESDKIFFIFTKDYGLVYAHAQSVRELKGKLRASLLDFSRSFIELVEGKNGWKLTNAEHLEHFAYPLTREKIKAAEAIGRVAGLLRKLCRGEEKNEELYRDVLQACSILASKTLSPEEVMHIEILTVMRILHRLGYWGEDATLSYYLTGDLGDKALRDSLAPLKLMAIRTINKSLKSAQM